MLTSAGSSAFHASVVICTYNPRADHLDRTLDALRRQTLPLQDWELLLVDNASKVPLASGRDLSWHPNARHVLETQLGLSRARAKGIAEAAADLVIFVDDDNVLNETYLAEALRIARDCPFLGAWGAGCIQGEFEVEPLESLRSWLPVRESAVPRWSNLAGSYLLGESPDEAIPWGAGLCIRKELAIAYREFCDQSSIYISDRHGASLVGGGDTEIAFVCCSRGLGVGVFPELKLTHLIPRHRVSDKYLARFAEGTCLSNSLLRYKWQHKAPQSPFSARNLLSVLKTVLLCRGVDRDVRLALVRGVIRARAVIRSVSPVEDRPSRAADQGGNQLDTVLS
jgi:glycosyltransferase involved in cell wall biosynthesis